MYDVQQIKFDNKPPKSVKLIDYVIKAYIHQTIQVWHQKRKFDICHQTCRFLDNDTTSLRYDIKQKKFDIKQIYLPLNHLSMASNYLRLTSNN